VVISTACYTLGPHTSIKTVNDRLLSVQANGDDFAGKPCVTAVSYGVLGWEGYAREAVNNFARFLHLKVVGNMLVQAAMPGEVIRADVLAEAREMAGRLICSSPEDSTLPGVINCRNCGSGLLQISPAGQVRCVMCGAKGSLEAVPGGFAVDFSNAGQTRYSPEGVAEHNRTLAEIKQRFIATRNEIARLRKPYDDYNWWVEPNSCKLK